jgi:hypothetical protein
MRRENVALILFYLGLLSVPIRTWATKDPAVQALQTLHQRQKRPNLADDQFAAQKINFSSLFNSVVAVDDPELNAFKSTARPPEVTASVAEQSANDAPSAAPATPSIKADEAETLTLIVAALRRDSPPGARVSVDNEKEFCDFNKIAENNCDTAFRKTIKYVRVKLNPKGQEGAVVEIQGPGFCGSGGCSGFLLRRTTDGYEDEGNASIGALEVSGATTNGYYDLIFHGEKRYNAPDIVYKWDGSKYIVVSKAPTVQAKTEAKPAQDLQDSFGETLAQYRAKNQDCVSTPQFKQKGPYLLCDNTQYSRDPANAQMNTVIRTVVFENGVLAFFMDTSIVSPTNFQQLENAITKDYGPPLEISPIIRAWPAGTTNVSVVLVLPTLGSVYAHIITGSSADMAKFIDWLTAGKPDNFQDTVPPKFQLLINEAWKSKQIADDRQKEREAEYEKEQELPGGAIWERKVMTDIGLHYGQSQAQVKALLQKAGFSMPWACDGALKGYTWVVVCKTAKGKVFVNVAFSMYERVQYIDTDTGLPTMVNRKTDKLLMTQVLYRP